MDDETRARIEKEAITYVIKATGYQVLPEHDTWKEAYIAGAFAEHSRITELLKEKDNWIAEERTINKELGKKLNELEEMLKEERNKTIDEVKNIITRVSG